MSVEVVVVRRRSRLGLELASSNYGNNILLPDGQREKENILTAYRGTLTPAYTINLSEPFKLSIGTIYTLASYSWY